MTVTIFTDTTKSRHVYKSNAVYLTARNAAVADGVGADTILICGQRLIGDYYLWRLGLLWNTTTIPDTDIITAARIRLYCNVDASDTDFDLTVTDGSAGGKPSDPVVVGDYDRTLYSGNGGTFGTAGLVVGAYNNIDLNATGRGWISKTGITRFMLQSSRDIGANAPGGNEYVRLGDLTTVGQEPKLEVTHSPASLGGPAIKFPLHQTPQNIKPLG